MSSTTLQYAAIPGHCVTVRVALQRDLRIRYEDHTQ